MSNEKNGTLEVASIYTTRKDPADFGLIKDLHKTNGFETSLVTVFPGASTDTVSHPTKSRFALVIEGSGFVQELVDGEVVSHHDIKTGSFVFVGPGRAYKFIASNHIELELLFVQDIKYNARLAVLSPAHTTTNTYIPKDNRGYDQHVATDLSPRERSTKAVQQLLALSQKKGNIPAEKSRNRYLNPTDTRTAVNLPPIAPPADDEFAG